MIQAPGAVWAKTTPSVLRLKMSQAVRDSPSNSETEKKTSGRAGLQALNREIGPDGLVKYDLLLEDSSVLDHNIEVVKGYSELEGGFESQKDLAFYCNAYNMWCLYLATKRLRKSKGKWKGNVNLIDRGNMFYFSSVIVAGLKMNLLKLENDIIRKFKDPRIHCAINCASWSCPRLPQRIFDAETLNTQLDERTKRFINRDGGVVVREGKLYISPIFKWYREDFDKYGDGIIPFLNSYWQGDLIPEDMQIQFQVYDWSLNSTKNPKNLKE